MILATDVHYEGTLARAAGVLFEHWTDAEPLEVPKMELLVPGEYVPGEFYKRELPCLLALLDQLSYPPELIVIDGYVYLDDAGKAGLGLHLYRELNEGIPVVGVAKTAFHANRERVSEVLRGESRNPLRVTAVGMDKEEAAAHVAAMHGEFRIPKLLKLVDQACRSPL